MQKKSFMSFIFLFTFWLLISEAVDLQHIIVGIVLSIFIVWFWRDSNSRLPSVLYPRGLLLFARCIIMLIGYVIKSNIEIAKTLLFSDLSEGSIFLELKPGMKSDWGRVFLATCITITPGTVTVDIDPETGIYSVHALNIRTGESLYYWRLIIEIKILETEILRREAYDVDTRGVHGSDTISTSERDNRPHSN